MASRAIHPGEHLAEELDALDMSAAELARRLKVPTNRVTAILNGQRAISGDTALRLAHFFGTSPQFWLNLQSLYEIRLAEEKSGKAIKKLPSLKRGRRGSRVKKERRAESVDAGKAILPDNINATIGFEELSRRTKGPTGDPPSRTAGTRLAGYSSLESG